MLLKELRHHLTLSFAKVAEYQRRGVVHFHAVIRLDGPGGPDAPPPAWATTDTLTQAIQHATKAVSATASAYADQPERVLRWGSQLDIRPITLNGDLTEQAVAGYIAKYATKAAECVGTLDRRINPLDNLNAYNLRDHARRLITTCMQLGTEPDLAQLRLADWAHMLDFRGHFSTRSRHYSATLGDIRADREHHARLNDITTGRLPLFDEDTVLVISEWEYAGKGHTLGDRLLAAAITGTQCGGVHDL
ncbi:replication initiator [Nonomuraea sp. NPDC050786]|uniref:replication initiator n=1 Tax=Nonomuraea sp. NPDC050786 TaxID=3154840 RepID=UPI0033DEE1F7